MRKPTYGITLILSALLLSSCASTKEQVAQQQSKETLDRIASEQSAAAWEQAKKDFGSQSQSRSLQNMRPKDGGTGSAQKGH